MSEAHTPHDRIAERAKAGPHTTTAEAVGFNGKVAILITNMVGTMWCAYAFMRCWRWISLPDAVHKAGTAALIAWTSPDLPAAGPACR